MDGILSEDRTLNFPVLMGPTALWLRHVNSLLVLSFSTYAALGGSEPLFLQPKTG